MSCIPLKSEADCTFGMVLAVYLGVFFSSTSNTHTYGPDYPQSLIHRDWERDYMPAGLRYSGYFREVKFS